ncbi:Wdr65, partial [Symbiodinium pilosum]
MAFDPLDRTLVTLGEDGKVCEWSTENWSALNEYGAHGEAHAVATAGEGLVWAGVAEGDRSTFRKFHQGVHQESEDFALHASEHLYSMELYSRPSEVSILAGDRSGNLIAFCSLTGVMRSARLGLHSDAITAVCISADGHTVATAGKDGAMFVLAADGISDTARPETRGGSMEVVMINRGDIQLRQDEIQDLTMQISTLKAQIEEDAARLQSECRARVEEARRQDQEKIQSLRSKYETLQQASTVKERDSLRKMKAMQALHVQAADDQEKSYDKRMRADAESYDALEAELRDLEVRFEQARQKAQRVLEAQEHKQEKEVHNRLNEKDAEIQKLKDLIAFTQKRFDAMLDQEGMEQSLEISEIKKKNQEELEQQHLVEYKLKKDQ